jgi:hypothetical protein
MFVAPDTLRSYYEFKIFIFWDQPEPASLEFSIIGRDETAAVKYKDTKSINVQPSSKESVPFQVYVF